MSNYNNPRVPIIENPINLDAAIQEIQISLGESLSWLDKSFGRAYHGYAMDGSNKIIYPEVYDSSGEYINVMPNDYLKAHSFFKVDDPGRAIDYKHYQGGNSYEYITSIIFYFQLDKISTDYDYRFTEVLKKDIFNVLKNHSSFVVQKVYEKPELVFAGYTINETISKLFKHPFAGIRLEGTLNFRENC